MDQEEASPGGETDNSKVIYDEDSVGGPGESAVCLERVSCC